MISEITYAGVKDRFVAWELDASNVVGKSVPVKVYQLIGKKGNVDKAMMQTIDAYEKGLHAYRNREWDQSVAFFNQALAKIPDDPPPG